MIRIPVAGNAPYSVAIGPLAETLPDLAAVGRNPTIVSDARVWGLHGDRLVPATAAAPILLPEGEAAKDWATLQRLIAEFAARGLDRDSPVVAFGGGSIGDVTGLAASLFKRGCPIVHVPTTLLAQADSAVGGKTAIDSAGIKNLVGSFHEPALVLVDPALTATLDDRQRRAGYAEIVKYGLVDDPALFGWCEQGGASLLAGDMAATTHAVTAAVTAKARLVAGDVADRTGQRALLNLGHSFAHAVEAEAGLGTVLHGEAVALGMVLAFAFSQERGWVTAAECDRVRDHLAAVGLPVSLAAVGLVGRSDQLVAWMAADKKNAGAGLTLILSRGIGRAVVERGVAPAAVAAFLASVA